MQQRVQELAMDGQDPPVRYIQREPDRPIVVPSPLSLIPTVDLGLVFESDGGEIGKLKSALQSWGLFQAIGHGIPNSVLDEVRNITREFFKLPVEDKQRYSNVIEGGKEPGLEGYGNDRVASEDQILDWSDRLYLLVEPENERKPNFWPEKPSSFRTALHEYTTMARLLTNNVLKAMAKMVDLDENYFVQYFDEKAEVFARFNYYPPCSRPELVFGIKPHKDATVITIVLPDDEVEGLQVLKDGEWVMVPTLPRALIINMGDFMEIMSNGMFKSPVHRAVTNPAKERISVAMFYSLEADKVIEPAEGLIDEKRPRLYKKVTSKGYHDLFWEDFRQGKRTIDQIKVSNTE